MDRVADTDPVVMELLAGARNDVEWQPVKRLLHRFDLVRLDPVTDFDAAAISTTSVVEMASHLEGWSTA
jgi:predicted nucleic acid-binding protein